MRTHFHPFTERLNSGVGAASASVDKFFSSSWLTSAGGTGVEFPVSLSSAIVLSVSVSCPLDRGKSEFVDIMVSKVADSVFQALMIWYTKEERDIYTGREKRQGNPVSAMYQARKCT